MEVGRDSEGAARRTVAQETPWECEVTCEAAVGEEEAAGRAVGVESIEEERTGVHTAVEVAGRAADEKRAVAATQRTVAEERRAAEPAVVWCG